MANPLRTLCTAGLTLGILALVSPVSLSAQTTAVKCKDGTTSTSTGRGACSGHGGVDKTATVAEKKTVKKETKVAKEEVKETKGTAVTSTCADGTTTTVTGRGACSGHGGVKAAEVTSKKTGAVIPVAGTAVPPKTAPAAPKAAVKTTTKTTTKTTAPKSTVVGSGGGEDNNPAGAIAQCKDGMYSHAKNRTGACSRHGGVARWM